MILRGAAINDACSLASHRVRDEPWQPLLAGRGRRLQANTVALNNQAAFATWGYLESCPSEQGRCTNTEVQGAVSKAQA